MSQLSKSIINQLILFCSVILDPPMRAKIPTIDVTSTILRNANQSSSENYITKNTVLS